MSALKVIRCEVMPPQGQESEVSGFVTGLLTGLIVGVLVGLIGNLVDAIFIDPIKKYKSALAKIRFTCRRYQNLLQTYGGKTEEIKAASAAFQECAAALIATRPAIPFGAWIARRGWMLTDDELNQVDSRLHRLSSTVFGPSAGSDEEIFRKMAMADLRFLAEKFTFSLQGVTDEEVVQ